MAPPFHSHRLQPPPQDIFLSNLHREVSESLATCGIPHDNGVVDPPLFLDIVLTGAGRTSSKTIVIDVNPPEEFYHGTEELVAERVLRQRLLGKLGYDVVGISHFEWAKRSASERSSWVTELHGKALRGGSGHGGD